MSGRELDEPIVLMAIDAQRTKLRSQLRLFVKNKFSVDNAAREVSLWKPAHYPDLTSEEIVELINEAYNVQSKPSTLSLKIESYDEIEAQEVKWLWRPYLPLGELALLGGDPGSGKSWYALNLCAAISRGGPFPLSTETFAPANAVFLSVEDHKNKAIRPRLDVMAADLKRVFHVCLAEGDGDLEHALTLQQQDRIVEVMEKVKPKLLVIDPIQSFLGRGIDLNKMTDTRPLLDALGQIAQKFECTILLIRHLKKSGRDNPLLAGAGSIDFSAVVRSELLVMPLPSDPRKKICGHVKCQYDAKGPSIEFEIKEGKFLIVGESDVTAAQLLCQQEDEGPSALEDAKEFCMESLSDGPPGVPSKKFWNNVKEQGHQDRTVRRAMKELKIKSRQKNKNQWWIGFEEWGNREVWP